MSGAGPLTSSNSENMAPTNSRMNVSLLGDSQYFNGKGTKAEELRKLLLSKFDQERLEGMKRLVALMTLDRDVSSFFPEVVKNIITNSQEVKKLVYMYLIHYAETNADLALLSINTFQKDLVSSNQRVRANAMKAMASIRLPVVVHLVILALNTTIKDSSAYVRKAAAMAIPKVFSVDPSKKDELIDMISILLRNDDTEVLGCTMYAFNEVCPNRWDILHEHYRKICQLLADFDEWGQAKTLTVLLRYGRTQFASPFVTTTKDGQVQPRQVRQDKGDEFDEDDFYGDSKKAAAETNEEIGVEDTYEMPEDHRLLIKAASQLLHSRNSAVILAVAAIYFHLAPVEEAHIVGRAMSRTARHHREIAYCVLSTTATMAAQRPEIFRPYLKDYFVYPSDALPIRLLKLDILSNIATESSVPVVLREFQSYVLDSDKRFVTATIQAIGRCATTLPDIADRCMKGLMTTVSSSSEVVVAESVVVMRRLLQQDPSVHKGIVRSMVKLLDTIQNARARTAIVWIIGEYRESIPTQAPDALRVLAKSFRDEDDSVKLQILNLAVKLYLTNPKQVALLFKYVMDLCKFDMNYDIRDRARMLRVLFFKRKAKNEEEKLVDLSPEMKDALKASLLKEKPSPQIEYPFKGRERFAIASLAHLVNQATRGYEPLPDFPAVSTDSSTREPYQSSASRAVSPPRAKYASGEQALPSFYDEDESSQQSSSSSSGSDSSSSDSDSDSSSSDSDSESDSDSSDSDSDNESTKAKSDNEDSDAEQESSGEELDFDDDDELEDMPYVEASPKKPKREKKAKKGKNKKSNGTDEVNLLDLGFPAGDNNAVGNTDAPDLLANFNSVDPSAASNNNGEVTQANIKLPARGAEGLLLDRNKGGGLEINYSFSRKPSVYGDSLTAINLNMVNHRDELLENIKIPEDVKEPAGIKQAFDPILELTAGATRDLKIHVALKEAEDSLKFSISHERGTFPVTIPVPPGEMMQPQPLSDDSFEQLQKSLQGMHEHKFKVEGKVNEVCEALVNAMNVSALAPADNDGSTCHRFAAKSLKDDADIIFRVVDDDSDKLTIYMNCEDFMFSGNVVSQLKKVLSA